MKRNRLLVCLTVAFVLINSASVFAEPPKRTVLLYGNVSLSDSSPANGAIYEVLTHNHTDGALLSNRTGTVGSVVANMIYESNNNGTSRDYFNVTVVHGIELGLWNHVLAEAEYNDSMTVMPDLTLSDDVDGDGTKNPFDNCPLTYNLDQLNSDNNVSDGGDVCDICPADATDTCNPNEAAAGTIGTSGGTLENPAGTAKVEIPADALTENTSISITPNSSIATGFAVKNDTVTVSSAFIFGPNGTTFDPPVTITLTYNESLVSDESSLDIYYYNETTGVWEAQGATLDTVANTLTLNVSRFSVYVVAEFLGVRELHATVDINPDTLNLKSKGNWITAYIEFPSGGYDVMTIDVDTVTLNGTVPAVNDSKYEFVNDPQPTDEDDDGLSEFMVKFDRGLVGEMPSPTDAVTLSVEGEFSRGTFEGTDTIRVIAEGNNKTLNSTSLKLNKKVKAVESDGERNKSRVKVEAELLAPGKEPVKAVSVKEYIPDALTVKLTDGTFTGFGLIWQVGTVEKKETIYYTLDLPEVSGPTTYELKTVVEYQNFDDLMTLEKTTYLTVNPKGQVKLDKGNQSKSVKAKGKGYSKVHWTLPNSKGGNGASHGKKKGHDKDKGKKPPGKPDKPPKDKKKGK